MPTLGTNHLDFLTALANLLFDKIEPDTKFKNDRIREWCDNMPTPTTSALDSRDESALARIEKTHVHLVHLDSIHTVKGSLWPEYVNAEVQELCEDLRKDIEGSDVDGSIMNLYHLHLSKLLRSRGHYQEALDHVDEATTLLQRKLSSYPTYLPRYSRNVLLNYGLKSELYRISGDARSAMSMADQMLSESKAHKNVSFASLDSQEGFCPVEAWALYYLCEAHLVADDWDAPEARRKREWVFSHTFSERHYERWPVPELIKIMGSEIWRERYPHYYDEMADLVYRGTAKNDVQRLLRIISARLGRVRVKPLAPVVAIGLIALALFLGSLQFSGEVDHGERQVAVISRVFDETADELRGDYGVFRAIEDHDVEEMKRGVTQKAAGLVVDGEEALVEELLATGDDEWAKEDTLARVKIEPSRSGNEHGVGVA